MYIGAREKISGSCVFRGYFELRIDNFEISDTPANDLSSYFAIDNLAFRNLFEVLP